MIKKLISAAVLAIGLFGCTVYAQSASPYNYGCVVFTDNYGEREVCDSYYYYGSSGEVIYWDAHFGVWISPYGYYNNGVFYTGFYPGYHTYYHAGFYHSHGYYGGHSGGGYHGGHSGGHGGHHR